MNRRRFHRPPGCTPMTLGIPMWQRRVGLFIANLGNWIMGYHWGVDHFCRGILARKEVEELTNGIDWDDQ